MLYSKPFPKRLEAFFEKNHNFFHDFFRRAQGQKQQPGQPEQQRKGEGRDAAQVQTEAHGAGQSHEKAQLALAQTHAQTEQRPQGPQTENQVRRRVFHPQDPAAGAQHIIQQTQQSPQQYRAQSLGELGQGSQLHQ